MTIDTTKKYSFNGKIINDNNEEWPALVYLEYDEYDPRILKCSLGLENISTWPTVLENLQANPRIVGETPEGQNILIKYIGFSGAIRFPAKRGEVDLLYVTATQGYLGSVPFTTGTYVFTVTLLNAPSVRISGYQESSYLGEIKRGRKPDDGISLKSDLGNICIGNYYELKEAHVGIEYADVQIEMTQLIVSNKFNNQIIVEESIDHIENEIEDILTLLTFINRRSIEWYEIELRYRETGKAPRSLVSVKRRKIRSINDSNPDPLFSQNELKKGLLSKLVEAYKHSPLRIIIERSIIFLTASYERETIESQLQAVYSAIEAIANPLSKKNKMYYSPKKNLNEKKRTSPISKRIFNLISIYKINCWDFGDPTKIDLMSMIDDMFKRRNKMMHTGTIGDMKLLYADLIRLRALCERVILAELGFNDDDLFFSDAYRELRTLYKWP
jgi:hypothetical protein